MEPAFGGIIGKTYRESTPWWPAPLRPPGTAPNVDRRRRDPEERENGGDHVDDMVVLRADVPAVADARGPVDDQGRADPAAVGVFLVPLERGVAGLGPPGRVMVERVLAAAQGAPRLIRPVRPQRSDLTPAPNLAILWPECGTRSSWRPRLLGLTGLCRPTAGPKCETPSNGTCGTSPPG